MLLFVSASVYASEIKSDGKTTQTVKEENKMCKYNTRACLKKAFCKMCVTICGRFCPDEGAVAGYGN